MELDGLPESRLVVKAAEDSCRHILPRDAWGVLRHCGGDLASAMAIRQRTGPQDRVVQHAKLVAQGRVGVVLAHVVRLQVRQRLPDRSVVCLCGTDHDVALHTSLVGSLHALDSTIEVNANCHVRTTFAPISGTPDDGRAASHGILQYLLLCSNIANHTVHAKFIEESLVIRISEERDRLKCRISFQFPHDMLSHTTVGADDKHFRCHADFGVRSNSEAVSSYSRA
mmetsp:Transcript_23494/g.35475  ORF Transcript_23494/g.35475 Transcript_23494/m.35475 type:complete len:226 (-) Transcript_23494:2-679(-)